MNDYNDIPFYMSSCPDCPECGTTMGYNYILSEYKCPNCGYTADEYDRLDDDDGDEDDDTKPFGCRACGGPWPDCKTSCNLYN